MKMAGAIELGFTRVSYANAGFPDDSKLKDEQSHKIQRQKPWRLRKLHLTEYKKKAYI